MTVSVTGKDFVFSNVKTDDVLSRCTNVCKSREGFCPCVAPFATIQTEGVLPS